jgi:hypothetical protein
MVGLFSHALLLLVLTDACTVDIAFRTGIYQYGVDRFPSR